MLTQTSRFVSRVAAPVVGTAELLAGLAWVVGVGVGVPLLVAGLFGVFDPTPVR